MGTHPVLAVRKDVKAIDVFRLMDQNQRSGVAVVDESGVLVGNTSGNDLKVAYLLNLWCYLMFAALHKDTIYVCLASAYHAIP